MNWTVFIVFMICFTVLICTSIVAGTWKQIRLAQLDARTKQDNETLKRMMAGTN